MKILTTIIISIAGVITLSIFVAIVSFLYGYWYQTQKIEIEQINSLMSDPSFVMYEDGSYRTDSQVGCLDTSRGCSPNLD